MTAQIDSTDWKTLVLAETLGDSIKTSTDAATGFPTLTANGYSFAPMFAPEYATKAYDVYFKVLTTADDGSKWYEASVTNSTPKYGTFTIDADMVKEGGSLVITASPKDGYMVKNLSVNGAAVTIGEDNTYTVKNVSGDVKVEGSFKLINPPVPDAAHLEYTASVSSDFTASWENLDGIMTDWEPTVSAAGTGRGWGNWSQTAGSEHYVQYEWDTAVKMNHFELYWYDDGGDTRVPGSMKIMYLDTDGSWKEANMLTKFEDVLAVDQYNTIELDEITTSAVKLVMTVKDGASANGILRWKVSDVTKEVEDPDPEEPEETKVDKKALAAAIKTAETRVQKSYTTDSWKKFATALASAKKVNSNTSATQAEVDSACKALTAADKALKKVTAVTVDKKALVAEIKKAEKLVKKSYTADSWKKFATALASAKKVNNNTKATQSQVDSALKTLTSAEKALKKAATTSTSLAAPKNMKAAWAGEKTVTLSWSKTTGAEKYVIYRSSKKSSDYKQIATVKTTSYSDQKATAGKTVYYKIKAIKGKVKSKDSKIVSAYVLNTVTGTKAKVAKKTVTITFGKVKSASGYEIYRADKKNGKYKKVATISSKKSLKKSFTKMKKGTYYYKVRACQTVSKKNRYTAFGKVVSAKVK